MEIGDVSRHLSHEIIEKESEHSHKRHRSENSIKLPKNPNDAFRCSNPTTFRLEQQQMSSMVDSLSDPRTVCNANIDQELQITLEKYVKNQLLSSTKSLREDIQKQRQTRFASFTKSPMEKLINELHSSQSIANLHDYNKQVSNHYQRGIPPIDVSFLSASISFACY